jgi:hypothetical protein
MEPILYKKKITTIVNECYKIPEDMTSEDLYKVSPVVDDDDETSDLYPPGQAPAQLPEFDKNTFIESVTSYFDSYGRKMQGLISASTGSDEELSSAEENVFRDIWAIGSLLRPFYSAEFCERLTHQLRSLSLLEIQIISFIRSGYDIKTWTDRIVTFPVTDMGNLLSTYNNNFIREEVRAKWLAITNAWLAAIRSRFAKDTVKFDDNINIANAGLRDFAVYLANGIVAQKSARFLPPTMV